MKHWRLSLHGGAHYQRRKQGAAEKCKHTENRPCKSNIDLLVSWDDNDGYGIAKVHSAKEKL